MPRTIWSNCDVIRRLVASRCGSVKRRSVNVLIGVLVLAAGAEARHDAELVERSAHERRFRHEPGQADVARWLEIDLAEGGREIVGAVAGSELAEGLGERDRSLAGAAEVGHGVAQLLDLRQAERALPDVRHEADDAVVALRALEAVQHVAQQRAPALQQVGERIVRHVLDQRLLEVEHDHRVRRHVAAPEVTRRDPEHDRAHDGAADRRPGSGTISRSCRSLLRRGRPGRRARQVVDAHVAPAARSCAASQPPVATPSDAAPIGARRRDVVRRVADHDHPALVRRAPQRRSAARRSDAEQLGAQSSWSQPKPPNAK